MEKDVRLEATKRMLAGSPVDTAELQLLLAAHRK